MPADREELRARLRALFVEELEEHVLVLNHGLLALEHGDESAAGVQELFRSAHSLKGAAHSAGIAPAGALCHRLEDVLGRLRDGTLRPDRPTLDALFAAVDALADIGRRMRGGDDPGAAPVAEVIERLGRLPSAEGGDAPPQSPPRVGAGGAPRQPAPRDSDAGAAVVDGPAPPTPRVGDVGGAVAEGLAQVVPSARGVAGKLESLLNQAGELLLASNRVHALADDLVAAADVVAEERARLAAGPAGRDRAWRDLAERLDALSRYAMATDRMVSQVGQAVIDGVRSASMLPFAHACEGLDRLVRDLAVAQGKRARLLVEGVDVELDRPIVHALREPLLHLVRNAVHHGVEPADARERAGKPPVGSVTVAATLHRDAVEVTVADDGAGIDLAALRAAAERRGVMIPQDDELELVFAPGVSTAPLVTEVSGRGVGMDAVRARVEGLGGTVGIASQPARGTRATFTLPLTLSTLRVVLVASAGQVFAVPTSSVVRLVRAPVTDLRVVDGRETLLVDGRALVVLALARAVGAAEAEDTEASRFEGVVVRTSAHETVLVVSELLDERDVVMKPLGPHLVGLPWALGGTILPDGRVSLILNAAACVRIALGQRAPSLGPGMPEPPTRAKRILLVEDTFTTRALERSILEGAGYDVTTAVDGAEAWQLLQEHGADLVISDLQMPRMDGFELCQAIRASGRFAELPVVLVTSLGSDEDRRRGIEVGANAYIVKSAFEQPVLLEIIEQLV